MRVDDRRGVPAGRRGVLKVAQLGYLRTDEVHGVGGDAAVHEARVVHEEQSLADLPQERQSDHGREALELARGSGGDLKRNQPLVRCFPMKRNNEDTASPKLRRQPTILSTSNLALRFIFKGRPPFHVH